MPKKGIENPAWKGGRKIDRDGYILILVDGKYRREHRAVMEDVLGRKLERHEVVHHINKNRADNRPENLVLTTASEHRGLHRIYEAATCHPEKPHYARGLCLNCYVIPATKKYRESHKEELKARKRAYHIKNAVRILAEKAVYRDRNRELINQRNRERHARMTPEQRAAKNARERERYAQRKHSAITKENGT